MGIQPLAGTASLSSSVMEAEARLRGWSEAVRSRRRALSVGCRNGDSPLRSPAPSSLSLVCKCICISYDLSVSVFSLAMISIFRFPPTLSLPQSLFSSLSPSPWPVLLHLSPFSSSGFRSLCLFIFIFFILRRRPRIHEERKKKGVLLWVKQHL